MISSYQLIFIIVIPLVCLILWMRSTVRWTTTESITKNCFVLLERLDKAVLDRYSRKKVSLSVAKEYRKRKKGRPLLAKPSSKTAEESPQKNCSKQRRKRIRGKPLYCTEDEDEYANLKENIPEKTAADNLSLHLLNKHPEPEIDANHNGTVNGSKKMNGTGIEKKGFISESFLKHSSNKTVDAVIQPESNVRPTEGYSQKDVQKFPEKMEQVGNNDRDDFDLDRVKKEKEVEVVEEYIKFDSFKTELKWDEEDKHRDCAPAQMQEFEFEENESRDEGEDDRATVVFDRSFDKEETHFEEVFEKGEERILSVTEKFQKKKMMNRKKKTLVKFKRRRSLVGRNLAKIRKLKSKKSEVRGSAEKEPDSERNMGEVCGLVKRLHELYRIILQLQKELPMNAEQADYFVRTIKAQQENFYKEIKKSEKTVMNGYDKMLSSFGNASMVSVEIGKRTSLSKEDIADVISQCKTETLAANLQEVGPPQPICVEKSNKEGLDNSFNHPRENPAPGSGSADPVMTLPSQSIQSSGHYSPAKSTLQRPNNEPNVAKVETRENHTTEHFLHGPSNSLRVSLQNSNNTQVQRFNVSKPRAHISPRENFPRRTNVSHRDSRFMRCPQQDPRHVNGNPVRPPLLPPVHSHLSNIRAQYRGGLPIHRDGISAVNYLPVNNNVEFFHVSDSFARPAPLMSEPAPRVRIQSLMDVNPFPFGFPQGRLLPQHFLQVQNPCSVPSGVRLASGPYFDRSKEDNAPAQANRIQSNFSYSTKSFNDFQRPTGFPSSKSSECNVFDAPNHQSFPKEGQCSLRNLLATFSRFLQSNTNRTQTYPVTEPPASFEQTRQQTYSIPQEPASKSVALESSVLDPTVPQKLTMRNCRLEAGPVLRPKNEGVTSKECEKPCQGQESVSGAGGAEALNQRELNSRVYMCAQYGCKNPGVRICKGCLSIIYCSETCQLKHWTVKHKTECHQLKELRG